MIYLRSALDGRVLDSRITQLRVFGDGLRVSGQEQIC